MALKSAKIAGLKVEGQGFQGAMRWLEAATDRNSGKCAYAGNIDKVTPGAGSIAMTAAGMLMRQFLGAQRDDEIVTKAADFLGQPANLPGWAAGGGGVNFYYWYYGTLCMFQKGGEHWNKWNTKIKEALLPSQCKGGPLDGTAADKDGSWDPVGAAGIPSGGRVFSTSLGALCLEVYYRYLPLYGK
jgi:hypothetical protein